MPSFPQMMMQVATRFGFHPHHGGRAPQAGRRETLRDSADPAFQEPGVAGPHRDRDGQAHHPKARRQQGYLLPMETQTVSGP